MSAERAAEATIGREFEILLGATYGDLCKIRALGLDALAQVVCAGALQLFLENLVAERVEDFHLHGLRAALRIRKDAVVDVHVTDGIFECWMDRVGGVFFVFVDGEFALVICRGGLAFLEEVHRGALDGLALVVGN